MLTLLTATGCRPKAWAICERLMAAQTFTGRVKWVIVDDGIDAQEITFERPGWELVVIRPEPFWKPGQNTQARNLAAGMARIEADERVVVVEDDDAYAPDWLATVDCWLEHAELVGSNRARYYNVATRTARQLHNEHHASLCSTAMRGDALKTFFALLQISQKFIDIELWKSAKSKKLFRSDQVVGIKGLPGRFGIGMGHRPDFQGQHDKHGKILREWVGDAAALYLGAP